MSSGELSTLSLQKYSLIFLEKNVVYTKKIIDALNIIKPPFNVNEVAQKAAIESLKDKKFISRSVKHNYLYATKLKDFLKNYDISSNKVSVSEIIKKVNSKTKMVFLANPNNPTGTYLTKFELINLRKRLRKNILLVVDDAYAEYMQNKDYKSGLDLFKNKQNVFILRTFSKIYGLSSLRVGWGYGSKKIIDALNIIKPPFNVNEVAQKAAIESLKDKKFITRSVKHNYFYATKLKDFLSNYDISSNKVSANFLLLNFNKCELRAKSFYEKLKRKGIILRSTEEGYKIKNMLRLTIGSKEENIKFIKATQNIFRK